MAFSFDLSADFYYLETLLSGIGIAVIEKLEQIREKLRTGALGTLLALSARARKNRDWLKMFSGNEILRPPRTSVSKGAPGSSHRLNGYLFQIFKSSKNCAAQ